MSQIASFYLLKDGRRQELSNVDCSGAVYMAIWDWCESELDLDVRFPAPQTEETLDCALLEALVARLGSDEERVWSLFRGATWWLPLADSFFFQAPLPTDDQAMVATLGGLRKELEKLNQLAWQADEDTILDWADTEGYPADGAVNSDGQYSKADIPEHTQYDTQSLAKFAFSMFWRAMRFAEEQQVPILLDY